MVYLRDVKEPVVVNEFIDIATNDSDLNVRHCAMSLLPYLSRMIQEYSLYFCKIKPMFITLFRHLGESVVQLNEQKRYAVDTIPIVVCGNIRIRRSKIYTDETFRGYQSSKRRYFYGLKIHLLVTAQRQRI